uniref:AKH2 n=1 Tax=Arundo donax TaxID=35708 RepID=A0A0A9ER93_ARUDO
MQGLAVASPLPPPAAATCRRTPASSYGREAVSQCSKYELNKHRSLGGSLRIGQSHGSLHRYRSTNLLRPAAAISVEQDEANTYLPKGDMWSVHKFGGTCMGTPQRIQSVADIVLADSSERKLIIVSAISKVTDIMYNLVHKAQSRDDSYTIALQEVFEKHVAAAKDLLNGEDLA